MKYLYIAGLEHSGTTLLNHLLSQHPDAIGLGEVSSFFSPGHMRQYMEQWGNYADVRLCSCGKDWDACEFWGGVKELNGLVSDDSLRDKYQSLISYIKTRQGENSVVVDSSKNAWTLKMLIKHRQEIGIEAENLIVVVMIKDVRNFTTSIYSKEGSRRSMINYMRTFNWWLGANRSIFESLAVSGVQFVPMLYEQLCDNVEDQLKHIFDNAGLNCLDKISLEHGGSHIAMGNKNFIMRNNSRIHYDNRWFLEDGIQAAYLLHAGARHFNKKLYAV
jgi:hypothetical protein